MSQNRAIPWRKPLVFAAAIITALSVSFDLCGQGTYISTCGPVNRSMGGASTAAPLGALGAIYWNPATISGLEHSETEFGLDLLFSNHEVSSSFGGISGSTTAEPGVFPIPNFACVYQAANPAITFGLGVNSVAGLKTNLPADPTNPVLAPPPGGLGRVSSEASFLQLAPVISVAFLQNMSVAVGPVVTMGQVSVEPFVFDAANADGAYSSGRATNYHWGGGVQAGVYYVHDCCWSFGASVKSPAWMQEFRFFGEDSTGAPRELHADIDLPLIASVGTSYAGLDNWLFALDVRYFDYANTPGFGDPAVFDTTGRLQGLDWSSVFAVAAGAQRRLSDRLLLRAGYTFNQNPIENNEAFFNLASPLIYEHMISVGTSYEPTDRVSLNVSYSYLVENSREGPLVSPAIGPIPGFRVSNDLSAHFLSGGITVRH